MYKIIGNDGRQYGPVTIEQLKQWFTEGRVNAQTLALAEGATEWKPLGALPEFANFFAPAHPPLIAPTKPGSGPVGQWPKTNSYATASLVFGILSLTFICCCGGFPFNVLGLVFSLVALGQISDQPAIYTGRSLAIAGLVLSIVSFLFLLFGLAASHPHIAINSGRF